MMKTTTGLIAFIMIILTGKVCKADACCEPEAMPTCLIGTAGCCSDGTWACPNGESGPYLCGGVEIDKSAGKVCETDTCCEPEAMPTCLIGTAGCCSDGTWACPNGESVPHLRGGIEIDKSAGKVCETDTCCEPEAMPTCLIGTAGCCSDGTWACPNGESGPYLCGGVEIDKSTGEVCKADPCCDSETFSTCFSGDARVQVESKGSVEMAALQIGDHVLVSGNKYEPVYSFGHRDATSSAEYLEIHSDDTNDPLQISPDHMILSGGEHWAPAATLRVGDTLTKGDGGVVVVTKILQDVTQKGIFAPFTASGSIVVNDIVASNFIAFQGSEYLQIGDFATPFTFQWLAHTFESGHRLACSSGFVACDQETYTDSGVSHWVDTPHQVGRWLLQQHAAVTLALLVPLYLVFGFLSVLEHPVWLFTLLGAVMLARSFRVKSSKTTV